MVMVMIQIRKMTMVTIVVFFTSITGRVNGQVSEEYIKLKEMIGKPAPEFTVKDINGKDFSLFSLRGKYVILDFWGTWCSACIKAFPKIKQFYTANRDEFEIVGIAFDCKLEAWRKDVLEKHSLPWINVFDDISIIHKYNVTFAPMYFLIDKYGIIVDLPGFDDDGNLKRLYQ